ncbi:MAG: hypothetical protein ACXVCP_04230 [Bdellovibrio sp.]
MKMFLFFCVLIMSEAGLTCPDFSGSYKPTDFKRPWTFTQIECSSIKFDKTTIILDGIYRQNGDFGLVNGRIERESLNLSGIQYIENSENDEELGCNFSTSMWTIVKANLHDLKATIKEYDCKGSLIESREIVAIRQ